MLGFVVVVIVIAMTLFDELSLVLHSNRSFFVPQKENVWGNADKYMTVT